jgi:hypothetical protein
MNLNRETSYNTKIIQIHRNFMKICISRNPHTAGACVEDLTAKCEEYCDGRGEMLESEASHWTHLFGKDFCTFLFRLYTVSNV